MEKVGRQNPLDELCAAFPSEQRLFPGAQPTALTPLGSDAETHWGNNVLLVQCRRVHFAAVHVQGVPGEISRSSTGDDVVAIELLEQRRGSPAVCAWCSWCSWCSSSVSRPLPLCKV
eukprot:SAG31_NODE_7045_length_1805_cov_3.634232_1_plen_117_part_00